jgi:hypothetical protein
MKSQMIRNAYRDLYKASLYAVEYSSPARNIIRTQLRKAFRQSPESQFDPQRIENTIQFLYNAAKNSKMEHRVLKNLIRMHYWEEEYM